MKPSIYKKVAEVQCALMGKKIPKTGYNKFNKFEYYELEDLIPPIFEECFKRELFFFFNFTEDAGVLKIKDWGKEGVELSVRVPMPPISELKTMNLIQSEGAYITYLKRYLLVNTFLITEKDVIDSTGLAEVETKAKKPPVKQKKAIKQAPIKEKAPKKQVPKKQLKSDKLDVFLTADQVDDQVDDQPDEVEDESDPTPKPVVEAMKRIREKGIPITQQTVKNHIAYGSLTVNDRIQCNKFIKQYIPEAGGS